MRKGDEEGGREEGGEVRWGWEGMEKGTKGFQKENQNAVIKWMGALFDKRVSFWRFLVGLTRLLFLSLLRNLLACAGPSCAPVGEVEQEKANATTQQLNNNNKCQKRVTNAAQQAIFTVCTCLS